MKPWYKNIQGGFNLPIQVEKDSEYLISLKNTLKQYTDYLSYIGVEAETVVEVDGICTEIINSIEMYYKAEILNAQNKVHDILKSYAGNPFVYSDLQNSYAFRLLLPFYDRTNKDANTIYPDDIYSQELSFFKARINEDPTICFTREEMLHIPLNNRGKVQSQRFSIAGIPCVYYGTSSYVCWLELGKPASEIFFVSSHKITKSDLRILNLACPWQLICGLSSGVRENYNFDRDKTIIDMLKTWPLVCATSYRVKEENRSFKSEYIVSQLIMLNLKRLSIDAVSYISKQVDNDFNAFPLCVNLAMPAMTGDYLCKDICSKVTVGETVNFGEYNMLVKADRWNKGQQSYLNRCFDSAVSMQIASTKVPYYNSIFGEFDNYLVSQNHTKIDLGKDMLQK